MSVQEIYLLIMTVLVLIIVILIGRLVYIYQKQKADLSKVILKLGETQIDQEIDAMSLRQLIDHSNQRNSQSSGESDAKSSGSNGDPNNPK